MLIFLAILILLLIGECRPATDRPWPWLAWGLAVTANVAGLVVLELVDKGWWHP